MRARSAGVVSSRPMVMALAGVASAVEVGRVRARLAREGEEPCPVELSVLHETQQLVVVGLGLARIADDERRAEGGVGLAPADRLDAPPEAAAVAPAPHRAQQSLR